MANRYNCARGDILCVSERIWVELWHEQDDLRRKTRAPVELGEEVLLEAGCKVIRSMFGADVEDLGFDETPRCSWFHYTKGE